MKQIDPAILIEQAKKYWNRIMLVVDRDKLKATMSPEREWDHLLVIFVVWVIVLACVSGYLYLDIKSTAPGLSGGTSTSDSDIIVERIRNAVDVISENEAAFNNLVNNKTRMKEPSDQ